MLCGACLLLLSVIKTHPRGEWIGTEPEIFDCPEDEDAWAGSHHIDPGAFLEAARKRCYICSTIYRDCSTELREQAGIFRTFYELKVVDGGKPVPGEDRQYDLDFSIEVLDGQGPIAKQQVFDCSGTFKILPKKEISTTGHPLGLTSNTFTGKCAEQVQNWLETCSKNHPQCNQDWRMAGNSPSRLLNVGSESREFCLETFAENTSRPKYVTLSHCWGAGMTLTLRKSNLRELVSRNTLIAKLPKRFQDAVAIARWMKIDYIWIDALCIIQDSEEDWLSESAKMGDIYTNSYCNIAATSGDQLKGCFTERVISMVEPFAIPDPLLHDETPTYVIGYDDFWSNSLLDTPLHTRGWVLQERLLSPRTIHFGQEQIFWECRYLMACEAYPEGIPEQFCNRRTHTWRQADKMLNPENQPQPRWTALKLFSGWPFTTQRRVEADSKWIYATWSKSVEAYMECKLSFGEDKLVAISGIAQKVARATHERYLAGLWDNSLLAPSLLWYVLGRRQADSTSSVRSATYGHPDYRAPSWSWASLEAKVIWNWPVHYHRVIINILKTHVVQARGSRLGRVTSAEMHIRGHLFEAELYVANQAPDGSPEEDGYYTLRLKSIKQSGSDGKLTSYGSTTAPTIYLDTPMTPQASMHVYLLPICTGWQGRSGNLTIPLAGLLLVKMESARPAKRFARVGIFGMDSNQSSMLYGTHGEDSEFFEPKSEDAHSEFLIIV